MNVDHSILKRQQDVQFKMLIDFDAFCKEHDLIYFMIYGTLLGAVRHKGFIPWDYDIDLAMSREEYNKFKQIKNLLPSHLSIWDVCYSDIDHAGLSRIMYQDEVLGGVHVDIFILDYEKEGWGIGLTKSLCRLLHFAKLSRNEKSILVKHFSGHPLKQAVVHISKVVKLLVGGSANAERLIYKLRVSKDPTRNFITLEDNISFPIEYFSDPSYEKFGNSSFFAPTHVDELLTRMYGNYMEIPPEGHQWLKEEGLE